MSFNILEVQPNEVKADFSEYRYVISGRPKAGKTSLLYGIVKEKYKGDLSKLFLCGFENGYSALKGIHAKTIEDWEDFVDVVDQLVDNHDKVPYRLIGLDTVDEMAKMATKYVIKKQKIADKKNYKTIGDIPFGKGYQLLDDAISEQVQRLDKVGMRSVFITHDKDKTFKTREGVEYDKTTLSLSGRVRDLVLNMVDFIIFIELAKETENGNLVDKRYIHFRGDSSLEAGSRFPNIVDKVEYSFKGFINAVEDAILAEYDGDEDKVEEAKEKQAAEQAEKIKEISDEAKELKKPKEYHEWIKEELAKLSADEKAKIKPIIKEKLGTVKVSSSEDIEGLQACVDAIKELAA